MRNPTAHIRLAAALTFEYCRTCNAIGKHTYLTLAGVEAGNNYEAAAIGEAILERNERHSYVDFCFGGANYDPKLMAIAKALDWEA